MIICDGCNVREPFEHRCHGERSVVLGQHTNKPCECPECREADRLFPDAATIKPKEEEG